MKQNTTIIMIIIAIAAAAGGFASGMKYQQVRRGSDITQRGNGQFRIAGGSGMMRNGNGGRGMRPVTGEVIKSDATSITVKLPDGSTKIVLVSATASVNKAEQVTAAELKPGIVVAVFGSDNADGSVTAQNIQINPRFSNTSPTPTPGK